MKSRHGIGDVVRCIKRGRWIARNGLVVPGPVFGDICTVRGNVPVDGDEYIQLHEWPDYGNFYALFDPSKFVPIEDWKDESGVNTDIRTPTEVTQ